MPGKEKSIPKRQNNKSKKTVSKNIELQKQIDEIRNSAIALYNIMEKKGITNEKEFMNEYSSVSAKKK